MTPAAHFSASVSRFSDEAAGLLERALQGGGAYADLFYEHSGRQRMALRQNVSRSEISRPTLQSTRQTVEGIGIRVLSPDGSCAASSSDLSAAALSAAADEVASRGRGGQATAVERASVPASWREAPADAPDQIGEAEKRSLLQEAADAALSYDGRVHAVEIGYFDHVRRTLVATSEGTSVAVSVVLLGLRVDVALRAEGRRVHGYAIGGAAGGFGYFFDNPASELAREAVDRARRLAEARTARPGQMPIVIAAGWGGVWLHEAVGHLMEADARHPLAEAAPGLTLVDDGTLPRGRGSAPFDDEAVPAARTVLVADGRRQALLTDRFHAGLGSGAATGNGRRQDYRHQPLPRMTNLILEAGNAAPEDLIAGAGEGLYVTAVGRGKLLPDQNRFSFEVIEGYRIEGGRLTAPVRGARVEGPASSMLAGIRGVGSDLELDVSRGMCRKKGQTVPVSVGTPTVLVEGMAVVPARGTWGR